MSDQEDFWHIVVQGVSKIQNKKIIRTYEQEVDLSNVDSANIGFPMLQKSTYSFDGFSDNTENGMFSNIDYNTKAKINKGKYPIDVQIDLHGFSMNEAYSQLIECIVNSYNLGKKCILVITGWGSKSLGTGVIKENLHKWLNNDIVKPLILYYTQATKPHGGKGAFYILLRTKNKR